MTLHNISALVRDDNQGGLFDLTQLTFKIPNLPNLLRPYTVTKEREMKIDLISNDIYNTTVYSDLLLDINDIDNPLNIMSGDVIYYLPSDIFDDNKVSPQNIVASKILLNQNKVNIKDPNRVSYVENNFQSTPTHLDSSKTPISYKDGKITISPL